MENKKEQYINKKCLKYFYNLLLQGKIKKFEIFYKIGDDLIDIANLPKKEIKKCYPLELLKDSYSIEIIYNNKKYVYIGRI